MAIIEKTFSDLVDFTRASAATYCDATGKLVTAAPNEPRFDYDPVTGEALGLLLEGQATNLVTNSFYSEGSVWSAAGGGEVMPNFGVSNFNDIPTAFLKSGGSSQAYTFPGMGAQYTEGTQYVASVFFRRNDFTNKPMGLVLHSDAFGSGRRVNFNPLTGNVTSTLTDETRWGYEVFEGGIYKVWVSGIATATTTTWMPLVWAGTIISGEEGVEFWGLNLVEGTRPTSYIHTEGSQVTRAADDAVIPVGDWLNPNEGVLFFDYVPHGPIGAPLTVFAMGLSNGISNRITFGESSSSGPFGNFFWTTNGVNGVASANTYPAAEWGKRIRVALSWSGQDYALVADGNVLRSGTSSTPFPDVTKLTLGGSGFHGLSRRMNCTFNRAVIYPRALTNAQLQALTA